MILGRVWRAGAGAGDRAEITACFNVQSFCSALAPRKRRHAGVSQNDALSCEVPYTIESHSMLSVRKYENDE